jgi:hypothetical protein
MALVSVLLAPVSCFFACPRAHSDAMPYQHTTAKLAALLRFFSASCRGTLAVGPIRLQNIVPELLPDVLVSVRVSSPRFRLF